MCTNSLSRAHILPLRRRGHSSLNNQNSNCVTKNSNKWIRIVTCIHTYVRIVGRLLNIVYCSICLNSDEYGGLYSIKLHIIHSQKFKSIL